jgi:hypothetical protein
MLRSLSKTALLAILVIVGVAGLWVYYHHVSDEQKIAHLEQIRARLKLERRVAKILVTDQTPDANGVPRTTLLFIEYGRDGQPLTNSAKMLTFQGNEIHFDAQVIQFEDQYVEEADVLRGQTILLFVRAYSSKQTPESGFALDPPGGIPEIYRGGDPEQAPFEKKLWDHFWQLYDDPDYRKKLGVRHAFGEGLYGHFDLDHVYTITVQSNGPGSLTADPIDPLYGKMRDLMRPKTGS